MGGISPGKQPQYLPQVESPNAHFLAGREKLLPGSLSVFEVINGNRDERRRTIGWRGG
jgi:hypothetical protein